MAATLTVTRAAIGGRALSFVAATGGGDTFTPDDRAALVVQNGGASAMTVTVAVPGKTKYGQDEPDVTSVSIAAGAAAALGPFGSDLADLSDGLVHVTYSAATSVTVALVGV